MARIVAVVSAGQWGTALAVPVARGGHDVRLWFRSSAAAESFRRTRRNERRLPGVVLPDNVQGTSDLAAAVSDADVVVLATSSVGLSATCRALAPLLPPNAVVLSLIKAVFADEPRFAHERIARELVLGAGANPAAAPDGSQSEPEAEGRSGTEDGSGIRDESGAEDALVAAMSRRVAVLSGPNFAAEVARELPAGTTVAAEDPAVAEFVQGVVMSERFRVWTSTDVVGVQLGGALKNILAIGAGLSDGLGMGDNARAALVTRGVAEITRLGVALGAHPLTFAGVSGIGDVMLTCTGDLSRNRSAGLAIARGTSPEVFVRRQAPTGEPPGNGEDAEADTPVTVEGVATTKAARELAARLGIDMPITDIIYRIIYEGLPPAEGMHRLMTREPTSEWPRG